MENKPLRTRAEQLIEQAEATIINITRNNGSNAPIIHLLRSMIHEIATKQQAEISDYKVALVLADWQFEYSDDGSVYRKGRENMDALNEKQKRLDPSAAIWNQHCHKDFTI